MRLPRDLSGQELVKALGRVGWRVTRQTGSHIRLTITTSTGEHHITIPDHDTIKVGTLGSILRELESQAGLSRDELLRRLFP